MHNPARAQEEIRQEVSSGYRKISEVTTKNKIMINSVTKKIESNDLLKPDYAKDVSLEIARRATFNSEEALPGEDWLTISDRRRRALKAIQDKIEPRAVETYVVESVILPGKIYRVFTRDNELRRWLDPDKLLHFFGLKPGDTFVDVMCFEGLFSISASKIVGDSGKVYCIDYQSPSIEKLLLKINEQKRYNIDMITGAPEKILIDESIADVIFYGSIMYDLYNPIMSLKNSFSMLKDSGKLLVLEWREGWLGVGPSALSKLHRSTIIAFIENSGFNVESIEDFGDYFYLITAKKAR